MANTLKSLGTALLNATLMLILLILIFGFLVLGRMNALTDNISDEIHSVTDPVLARVERVDNTLNAIDTAVSGSPGAATVLAVCPKVGELSDEVADLNQSVQNVRNLSVEQVFNAARRQLALWIAG